MSYAISGVQRALHTLCNKMSRIHGLSRGSVIVRNIFLRNVPIRLRCGQVVRGNLSQSDWFKVGSRGYHELDTERFLCAYLRLGDVVIDVGAHVGLITTICALKVGAPGLVFAFEPDPVNYELLVDTIKRNTLMNVIPERMALSDHGGTLPLVHPQGAWGSFSYDLASSRPNVLFELGFSGYDQVYYSPVTTLSEYLKRRAIRVVDLVKVDVDGAEMSILRGALELLSGKTPPVLIMETSRFNRSKEQPFESMFTFLSDLGYEIWATPRGKDVFTRVREINDMPIDTSHDSNETANLFCHIPRVHGERWSKLWFAKSTYGSAVDEGS